MAVQKRMQMLKGTTWHFTQDAQIVHYQENPEYNKSVNAKRDELNQDPKISWFDAAAQAEAYVSKVLKLPSILEILWDNVKKDESFIIDGKSTNSRYGKDWIKFIGVYFPVTFRGKTTWLPYKGIEPYIESDEDISVSEYVIRSTSTGKFYNGYESWSNSDDPDWTPHMRWADTFMKAKRFKDSGKVKMHLLIMSGYYDGLPGAEQAPDWMSYGEKTYDMPGDWEMVKFDKLAKVEQEVLDLQNWYKRAWELRALTVQFGGPVRQLYSDLDKKNKLSDFRGMLVVRSPLEESHYGSSRYTDELDYTEVSELETMLVSMGLKKNAIKKAKDPNCLAIAFVDTSVAMRIKLAYTGKLALNAIDLDTMKEIIES